MAATTTTRQRRALSYTGSARIPDTGIALPGDNKPARVAADTGRVRQLLARVAGDRPHIYLVRVANETLATHYILSPAALDDDVARAAIERAIHQWHLPWHCEVEEHLLPATEDDGSAAGLHSRETLVIVRDSLVEMPRRPLWNLVLLGTGTTVISVLAYSIYWVIFIARRGIV